MGRLLAIGDIHGCREKLESLLRLVAPQEDDCFVFIGDYIDRGPDSPGVVEYLIDFGRRRTAVFLLGNHEEMLLRFLAQRDMTYLDIGGHVTLMQYMTSPFRGIPRHHLDFFNSLLPYYETEHFIFVHAGLRPPLPLSEQTNEDLLTIRSEFHDSPYDWNKTIVTGHSPLREPHITPRRIRIDTGAVFDGDLTCCNVVTGYCWSC